MGALTRRRTADELQAELDDSRRQMHQLYRERRQLRDDHAHQLTDERRRVIGGLVDRARARRSWTARRPDAVGELDLVDALAVVTGIDPAIVTYRLGRLLPDTETCANCGQPIGHYNGRWRHLRDDLHWHDGQKVGCADRTTDAAALRPVDLSWFVDAAGR